MQTKKIHDEKCDYGQGNITKVAARATNWLFCRTQETKIPELDLEKKLIEF